MWLKKAYFAVLMVAALGIALSASVFSSAMESIEAPEHTSAQAETTVTLDAVADATVRSEQPDTNFGTEDYLEIAYDSTEVVGEDRQAAVMIRFDVSSIPGDAVVDTAYLRLYLDGATGADPVSIGAFFLTSDWDEATVTWNSNPTISGPGLNSNIDSIAGEYKTWYIPWYVQDWVDDPASNEGVLLLGPSSGPYYERWFESRDHLEMVPELEVTYHLTPYTFSGHVYEGEPEAMDTPLEGVTVELWGDEDEWPEGGFERVRLATTETDAEGAFTLEWDRDGEWPYLHVIELDPPESFSTGADVDPPGYVKNFNVVSYRPDDLLETGEHGFGGIVFWDDFPEEQLPDLIVTEIGLDDSLICYQIENVGAGLAPDGHQTALLIDGIQEATEVVGIDLSPAETWEGCFDYTWECSDAEDSLVVEADSTDLVAEEDETNNRREEVWECVAPPDLIVTDIWPEDSLICYEIENVGAGLAPEGHQTALLIDEIQEATEVVGIDLSPAETWQGCFDYTWECSDAEDSVVVSADSTDVVAEENETNNRREEFWECEITPLVIVSGPTVSGLTPTSAVVSWETNKAADSAVHYDSTARFFRYEETDPTRTTDHQVTLVGLTPSTTYRYYVRSDDGRGESVESRPGIFETPASADDQNPTVRILDPGVVSKTVTIRAEAYDDTGVEKVEFYLDGELKFTDYSPPYEWVFYSGEEENGDFELEVKAFDFSGYTVFDDLTIPVYNFVDLAAPQVNIFHPSEGADVYGDTPVWVTVSDDSGWSEVEWFVDGKKMGGGQFPVSPSLNIKFWWDTRFFSQGSHSLAVQATDGDNKVGTDVILVNVANTGTVSRPKLVVTKHEMFRHGNAFALELTLENQGQATATDIEIVDDLTAFQPISRTFSGVEYAVDLDITPMRADTLIDDPFSLAAGNSRKYTMAAVPVLIHNNPPTPAVGKSIKLSYSGPLSTKYQETAKFEVLKTTVTAGSAPSEPIKTAHANAVREADYLILTNPSMLSFHNAFQDENMVLSDMARLAFDRDGVLGYLQTSNRNTLRNLIRTNGDWGKSLHADFRTAAKGYVLIVGETEIVPAWRENIGPVTWSNSACTTSEADLSDLPYADTGGSNAAPELIVGRIIGNEAVDLSNVIQTSLTGSFDRSHAFLVSGTDGTSSIEKLFTGSVDEIEKEIKSEFTVTKHHWKSITAPQRVTQFRNNTSGKDVVLYQGHGGPDSWGSLGTDDVLGDATTTPPTPGVSFGSANPVVFGWACLTGSYEDHVANSPCTHDGGDSNIAEAFLDRGAAVYIGATEVSPINDNRAAAKAFFKTWWKPNTTVGKAFTDLKRDRWSSSGYTQLWEYEYNLYGDPKYGSAPKGGTGTLARRDERTVNAGLA
ncbi:MAG: DNRLRE domain-containing protein, partial [Anaerolineae bacterium]